MIAQLIINRGEKRLARSTALFAAQRSLNSMPGFLDRASLHISVN